MRPPQRSHPNPVQMLPIVDGQDHCRWFKNFLSQPTVTTTFANSPQDTKYFSNMWEQLCISRDVIKFEIFLGFSQSSYNWNQCLPISNFLITVDLRIVGRCFIRSSTMVMIPIFASLLPFKQHSTIIIAVVKIITISQVINMFSWGFSQTGRLQVSEIWADTT